MLESEAPAGRDRHSAAHELWLAMRDAYHQYRSASAALDALASRGPGEIRSRDADLPVERAVEQQRTTFENYIEARLQFSEFLLSREESANVGISDARGKRMMPGQPEATGFWKGFATSRPALMAVAAALLLPTAFSLTYLVHEQKHVRDLDLVRDAMQEMLNRTSNQTQSPAVRLPVSNGTPQVAAQQPGSAPAPSVRPGPAPERQAAARIGIKRGSWRPVRPALPRPQRRIKDARQPADRSREMPQRKSTPARDEKGGSIASKSHAAVQLVWDADRNYYRFTLTPSRRFERVGPIRLSLHDMDVNNRFLDLTVMVDDFVLNQKHVNLNQPVWIPLRGRPMSAVLVVKRIARNQVQGYLSETRYQPSKTRRRGLMPLSSMKMIVYSSRSARIRPGPLRECSHTDAQHLPGSKA